MISAVLSARVAGLDRIKSGLTWRFANRLPIFGASRLPRSLKDRSLSANAGSSRLDLAWRMRNSVFMRLPKAMTSDHTVISHSNVCSPNSGTPSTNVPRVIPVEALLRHPEKERRNVTRSDQYRLDRKADSPEHSTGA